jgi:hypothetical protein
MEPTSKRIGKTDVGDMLFKTSRDNDLTVYNDLHAGLSSKAIVVNQKREVKSDGQTRVRFRRMG